MAYMNNMEFWTIAAWASAAGISGLATCAYAWERKYARKYGMPEIAERSSAAFPWALTAFIISLTHTVSICQDLFDKEPQNVKTESVKSVVPLASDSVPVLGWNKFPQKVR